MFNRYEPATTSRAPIVPPVEGISPVRSGPTTRRNTGVKATIGVHTERSETWSALTSISPPPTCRSAAQVTRSQKSRGIVSGRCKRARGTKKGSAKREYDHVIRERGMVFEDCFEKASRRASASPAIRERIIHI